MDSKMYRFKIKYIYVSLFVLSLFFVGKQILRNSQSQPSNEFRQGFKFNQTVVHIDLKGAPPKLGYLTELLREFKAFGVTALLMEYEDMFPFHGDLEDLKASNAYSEKELREFLISAKSYNIDIIPLVQTFGHLEFALKNKFNSLKEHILDFSAICPSRNASLDLIHNMINQVVAFHNAVSPLKIMHIGCDEVYYINSCHYCLQRKLTSWDIFVQHIKTVASFVHEHDMNIRVLIWDDMMRKIDPYHLQSSNLQLYVEPVVWAYKDVLGNVKHRSWYAYGKVFDKIWIASAFKGADGNTQIIPNLKNRYENHLSWMRFITGYKTGDTNKYLNVQGIFLTGWSRYDHTQPLCELLPIGMPSLVLNIILINTYYKSQVNTSVQQFNYDVINKWLEYLQCPQYITKNSSKTIETLYNFTTTITHCDFPHKDLYNMFVWMLQLEKVLQISSGDDITIEMASTINGIMGSTTEDILIKLNTIKHTLLSSLLNHFDEKTTVEILKQRIYPLKNSLKERLKIQVIDWDAIYQLVVASTSSLQHVL